MLVAICAETWLILSKFHRFFLPRDVQKMLPNTENLKKIEKTFEKSYTTVIFELDKS